MQNPRHEAVYPIERRDSYNVIISSIRNLRSRKCKNCYYLNRFLYGHIKSKLRRDTEVYKLEKDAKKGEGNHNNGLFLQLQTSTYTTPTSCLMKPYKK